jgi:acyl carrier protein
VQANLTFDDIFARLKPLLLKDLGISEAAIAGGDVALLGENSGIDSVGVLRLVMSVEKEFGIVIEDADINPENLQSLKGLVALIQRKLG